MKSRVPAKASKASLVARGLASKSKPPAFKRGQKGPQKPPKESKPGYSLYTSDSEDQASAVDRGLNRCAALLSNILDHEDKAGTAHSRVTSVGRPDKSTIKRVQASQASVRLGKHDTQKTKTADRRVVIPTARPDDTASPSPSKPHEETKGGSTIYNDRLMSSTPVLTAEERQKRQQLQRREANLQQELTHLKERYELLQKQQSPTHQAEQKLQLQNSMMQELDNHQKKENSFKKHTTQQHSAETQPAVTSGSEKLLSSNPKRSSARRSLDYSEFHVGKDAGNGDHLRNGFGDSQSDNDFVKGGQRLDDIAKQDMDYSVTQEIATAETKKRVRIVSPVATTSPPTDEESSSSHRENLSNSPNEHDVVSDGTGTRQMTPPTSSLGRPSSSSARTSDRIAPSSAENHSRMIQYLVDELRALLGSTGDVEVNRLLNEIDDAAKLLPYLMEKDKTTSVSQHIEQAVQPHKVENAQLRRRLLVAHQKLKEESSKKNDDKSSMKTDSAFELAACRSVNTVLQKQLTEEKNSKEEILRHRDQLSVNLSTLREEKKKFLQILSNKEQDYLRSKREWQQDTSKLTTENKKLTADLEAVQLSTEAEKKEINILTLSLKQKDAEIDRLKELTRGLQQSLTRLLSDMQQLEPKDLIKPGFLDKGIALDGLDKLLGDGVKTIGQTTASRPSPEDMPLSIRNNGKSTSAITFLNSESPSALGRIEEVITRRTPSQRSVLQSKKHLRFAHGPFSYSEPMFSLTSGLSHPLVKTTPGSGYGNTDLHERSAHAENMELPEGLLELEDLEDLEQNGGELSPLSSGEEEDFRRGLENLDANIARIQKSLRETALRT